MKEAILIAATMMLSASAEPAKNVAPIGHNVVSDMRIVLDRIDKAFPEPSGVNK